MTLRGPSSPYEVSFYAMTNIGGVRPARIERDSVNSVVVDNEPQDKHERMMVAARVALNPSGSACVAKETTLLPNIHGLPHLVCLLFAPTIEMRCVMGEEKGGKGGVREGDGGERRKGGGGGDEARMRRGGSCE